MSNTEIKRKLSWIAFLYFFSGLPLGLFYTFLPVYFRTQGIDLVKIGLFSSAGIFWSLKPIWAPLVDRYLSKKIWMSLSLFGISFSLLGLYHFPYTSTLFVFSLFSLTFFSALLDTALDGFVIEWIPEKELGRANGIRVSFYRIALIFAGGLLTAISQYLKFSFIFISLFLITFAGGFIILASGSLSKTLQKRKILSLKEQYLIPVLELLKRKNFVWVLIFIMLYKAGDALLGGMVYPFWVDKGFSRLEIGLISGTLGSLFTILGSLIGGHYTSKWKLKNSLLIFGALQAVSNLGYAFCALPFVNKKFIYLASIIESFTGGLGTASFITFLTALCRKEFSSTQYAIFSTLFSFTMVACRTVSGWGAKHFGYALYFFLTFFVAITPLFFIPYLFKKTALKEEN